MFKPRTRRKSLSTIQSSYKKGLEHELGIPFIEKGKIELNSTPSPENRRVSDLGNFKTHKRGFSDVPQNLETKSKPSAKFSITTIPETKTFGTIVFVSTFDHLFVPSEALAKLYRLEGEPLQTATYNRNVVVGLGRKDLEQIWNMLILFIERSETGFVIVQEILKHLESTRDFQTLCMVLCILAQESKPKIVDGGRVKIDFLTASETLGFSSLKLKDKIDDEFIGKCRKSRLGMSLYRPFSHPGSREQIGSLKVRYTASLITSTPVIDFTVWKQQVNVYADYLYCCGFFEDRCVLLKLIGGGETSHKYLDLVSNQSKCGLCRLPVRGLGLYCPQCFHGGHARCLEDSGNEIGCIVGCGCECSYRSL